MLERLDRGRWRRTWTPLAEEPGSRMRCCSASTRPAAAALGRAATCSSAASSTPSGALLDTPTEAERFACEALVAAVGSMVTMRIGIGAFDELPGMREPIIALAGKLLLADSA